MPRSISPSPTAPAEDVAHQYEIRLATPAQRRNVLQESAIVWKGSLTVEEFLERARYDGLYIQWVATV